MERKSYCDYLRIAATLAVVMIHVSGMNWYNADIDSSAWHIFNFYDSMVRWGVPVFVMISGSLFLGRDIPIGRIYSKYILRMVTAFLAWSLFYALAKPETLGMGVANSLRMHMGDIISGHYHMWFILMIIGLYMCMPIYRRIVADRTVMQYFLVLAFIFSCMVPWGIKLVNDYAVANHEMGAHFMELLDKNVFTMEMDTVGGYSFYFILGYFLDTTELTKKQRWAAYILGLAGFAFTAIVNANYSNMMRLPNCEYFENFDLNVVLMAVGVHTWFKYHEWKNTKVNTAVTKASVYMFGVYLVHIFFIDLFTIGPGFTTLSFNPVLSVPAVALAAFVCSLAVSAVLNHIPVIKDYCV